MYLAATTNITQVAGVTAVMPAVICVGITATYTAGDVQMATTMSVEFVFPVILLAELATMLPRQDALHVKILTIFILMGPAGRHA
jgi:hypothetical protein